jgi:hypothetical protein
MGKELNKDQQAAFNIMAGKNGNEAGESCFLTGKAGTGKSCNRQT